jgi:hypothetical protein
MVLLNPKKQQSKRILFDSANCTISSCRLSYRLVLSVSPLRCYLHPASCRFSHCPVLLVVLSGCHLHPVSLRFKRRLLSHNQTP